MAKRLILAVAGLLLVSPLSAQAPQRDSLLSHLIGRWVLRGHMAGKDVVHDVTFQWVLGGEYVEMHEVSRERTSARTPAYEAIVYLVHDRTPTSTGPCGSTTRITTLFFRRGRATASRQETRSLSSSPTHRRITSTRPSYTTGRRIRGRGTWTTRTRATDVRSPV